MTETSLTNLRLRFAFVGYAVQYISLFNHLKSVALCLYRSPSQFVRM